jgi:hypothetical protein
MVEKENKNKINYLDKTIHRNPTQFAFDIYSKPTTTSHSTEHIATAYNFLYNRVKLYPVSN